MTWGRFVVKVESVNVQEALDKIGAYDGRMRLKVENAVHDSTQNISRGAKSRVARKSGKTKASITPRFDRNKVTGEVYTKRPTAHLLEFGVKPAKEEPREAKALTIDQWGNRWYAARANIPGRAARPFMKPAYEDERPRLIKKISEAVKP